MRRFRSKLFFILFAFLIPAALLAVIVDYGLRIRAPEKRQESPHQTSPAESSLKDDELLLAEEWRTIIDVLVKNGEIPTLLNLDKYYNQHVSTAEWNAAIRNCFARIPSKNGNEQELWHSYPIELDSFLEVIKHIGYQPAESEWEEFVFYSTGRGRIEDALFAAENLGKHFTDADWDRLIEGDFRLPKLFAEAKKAGKKFTHAQWVRLLEISLSRPSRETEIIFDQAKKNQEALWEEDFKGILQRRVDYGDPSGVQRIKERFSKYVSVSSEQIERLRDVCIQKGDLDGCDWLKSLFQIKLTEKQWRTAYDGYIEAALVQGSHKLDLIIQTADAYNVRPSKKQLKQLVEADGEHWHRAGYAFLALVWSGQKGGLPKSFWDSFLQAEVTSTDQILDAIETATASGYRLSRAQLVKLVFDAWTYYDEIFDRILAAAKDNGPELTRSEWSQILEKELEQATLQRTTLIINRSGIIPTEERWTTSRRNVIACGRYDRAIEIIKLQQYYKKNDVRNN